MSSYSIYSALLELESYYIVYVMSDVTDVSQLEGTPGRAGLVTNYIKLGTSAQFQYSR